MKTNLFKLITLGVLLAAGGLSAQQVTIPAVETNVYDLLSGNRRTVSATDPVVFNQRWDSSGTTFDAWIWSITDSNSATASRVWRASVGGSDVAYLGKDGTFLTLVGFDGIGAIDLDYGSADITDHTFTSDGGTVVLDGNASVVPRFIEKHASSHTLTAAECYNAVYYITAASTTLTLPPAVDGMSIRVICTTANVGTVDADDGDLIILDGTALDDGDSVDSAGAAGDVIDLIYYDATGWFGVSISGTWVDGGAS